MQKPLRTADHPTATFRSTEVRVDGDHATLRGGLSLAGQTHTVELRVRRQEDGTVVDHAQLVQGAWGVTPYTGFLGALELRDTVDLDVVAPLRTGRSRRRSAARRSRQEHPWTGPLLGEGTHLLDHAGIGSQQRTFAPGRSARRGLLLGR